MNEKTVKIVHYVRIGIYLAMFTAFACVALNKLHAHEQQIEAQDPEPESEEFWPPDMVPHPGMPGEGPRKNEGDWA